MGEFLASLRDALLPGRGVPVVVCPSAPRTTTGYHLPTLWVGEPPGKRAVQGIAGAFAFEDGDELIVVSILFWLWRT